MTDPLLLDLIKNCWVDDSVNICCKALILLFDWVYLFIWLCICCIAIYLRFKSFSSNSIIFNNCNNYWNSTDFFVKLFKILLLLLSFYMVAVLSKLFLFKN